MLLVMVLGLGIGLILAGLLLAAAGSLLGKRMLNPALVRWIGLLCVVAGGLLILIAVFW
jgi:hypothetical protein